ncbi:glutathione peroxidase [Pseudomonas sp. nanlin1]|uniref:glutathione peroxidase n=1 Tax=Pseudomonas sp. nanlin1 TaxID=3040605 RepID=UPI00388D2959
MSPDLRNIPCLTLDGQHKTLGEFAGKVLLVVNTASQCGFTPQYKGLEELWQRYRGRGLMVLGFPCNQFGNQEPGDTLDIAQFCEAKFGVSFPVFRKVDVNGELAHPLFVKLKHKAPGLLGSERIKWNFTKFLVSRDGSQVKRFAPITKPAALEAAIEEMLG